MLRQIDDMLFQRVEAVILEEVKKSKHTKHKYHVRYKISGYQKWLMLGCIFVFPLLAQFFWPVSATAFIFSWLGWTPMLLLSFLRNNYELNLIEHYGHLFSLRKNPEVYHEIKRWLAEEYENDRRQRFFSVLFFTVMFITIVSLNLFWGKLDAFDIGVAIFFIYQFIDGIIQTYIFYVFDFDDPDGEDKEKAAGKMTDLVAAQFQRLLGQLNPGKAMQTYPKSTQIYPLSSE